MARGGPERVAKKRRGVEIINVSVILKTKQIILHAMVSLPSENVHLMEQGTL